METKVITGKVRASFAHVFHPSSMSEGAEEKYSISLIIPKDDEKTIDAIQAAIEAAKEAGKGKWNGKIPPKLKLPLRDGDEERPDDEAYHNAYFVNATSKTKPGIIDRVKNKIVENPEDDKWSMDDDISKEEFYSGCYCRASVNFYAFNVNGNKGIACGLNNLQKLADGDRLSGGSSADSDFDAVDEDDLM